MRKDVSRAVLDTCVLFKPTVRGVLLESALWDLFRPVWSDRILAEWVGVLRKRIPLEEGKALTLVRLATQPFPEALVEVRPSLVRKMRNDPKDRHVLAAAVAGKADYLVTDNLRDFPPEVVQPLGVEVVTPDTFLMALWSDHEDELIEVLYENVRRHGEQESIWTLLARLERTHVTRFAEAVRRHLKSE